MKFEWDPNKRDANIAKHGLDLANGAAMFDGRAAFTYPSPRGEEHRFVTVGLMSSVMVAVVWVQRAEAIRLISLERDRLRCAHLSAPKT
jgi:uncharacterized DUF497 family protein